MPSPVIGEINCPFIGLRPFEEADAARFFGRTEQVAALLRRLGEVRFLAVVGTSGCGKSSLVRAGLIPALKRGYLASPGNRWRIGVMRPGGDPFGALSVAANVPVESLRRSSFGLAKGLETLVDERESVLLVVDQFEELFRFRREAANTGEQSDEFVKLLLASAGQDEVPIYVVLTMRSDYLGDCAVFPGLPEALNDAQYLVPVLTRRQLREVVETPVTGAGAQIAPELVQRALNDVGQGLEQELDQLPVLQHALMRTWAEAAKAAAAELGLGHYANSGRMAGALNQHAQRLYDALGAEDRDVAKRVFQRLGEKEFKGRDIRRPTSFGELRAMTKASEDQLKRVIGQFQDFLTFRPEGALSDASMIDITHEALIRQWMTLRKWADEEARSARVYMRLDDDASRSGRLWEDPDLRDAIDIQKKHAWNVTWARRYTPQAEAFGRVEEFLRKSKRHRMWRRLQKLGLGAAALAIPAAFYFWQVQQTRQAAELHRQQAEVQKKAAEVLQKEAELERIKTQSGEAAARADRLLVEAASAHGNEKLRLEEEAKLERARSETLAVSAKDYQSLTQRREAELAALLKSRDDLDGKLKSASEENKRLAGEVARLEKDNLVLNQRLAFERLTSLPATAPPVRNDAFPKKEAPKPDHSPEPAQPTPGVQVKVNPKDGLPYVWIPSGTFSMGCSLGDLQCDQDEKPAHSVTISKGFWMGQTEVTQAAFQRLIKRKTADQRAEKWPASVDWAAADRYCLAAGLRLPTEAEWEFAARGGKSAGNDGLDVMAWYLDNSGERIHQVGTKKANAFGLHDMLGNLWEWTADLYANYERGATADPKGPNSGWGKVLRGGSFLQPPQHARASYRETIKGLGLGDSSGFRCVGEIP